MNTQIVVLLGASCVVLVAIFLRVRATMKVQSPFSTRSEMPLSEIHSLFFEGDGVPYEDFEELWMEIAEIFSVPSGLLRPTDRFGMELKVKEVFGLSDEDVLLGECLDRRAKERRIVLDSTPSLESVADYVSFLARRTG